MMICFYQTDNVLQAILLVISQLTVISLAGTSILLFKRGYSVLKQVCSGAALLLNVVLYVIMQLDSNITEGGAGLHLNVPYIVLLLITLLSLIHSVLAVLNATKNRTTINNSSIKEAFDNLPTGVCFFNEAGIPVLCNLAMQRFSFAVCGRDIQYITDLEDCLSEDFTPAEGIRKDGKVFQRMDDVVWQLEKRTFHYENVGLYTQFIALDVTDIHGKRVELTRENEQLRKVQENLQRLSANVVAVTREEEILNAKMRIHDEMGRCLVAAQKYLKEDSPESIPNDLAVSWQRATSILKYNNDTPDEDMLLQIRKTCEFVKLQFVETGKLPRNEDTAYLLTCAVRECVTNAVRYAEATALYADFSETDQEAKVVITNNGKPPQEEIREGGGLSTLRRRVERVGGTMTLQSLPVFRLTVTVPKRKEGDIL